MLLIVYSLIVFIVATLHKIMTDAADQPNNATRIAFGRRIRELRRARGLSQDTLAEMADLHRTYLSSVERGQRNIGLDNIHALARALSVSPRDLFPETNR